MTIEAHVDVTIRCKVGWPSGQPTLLFIRKPAAKKSFPVPEFYYT